MFLSSCAVRLMFYTPAVTEVVNAYRWRHSVKGSLQELYPNGMSQALINALLVFDYGFQAGQKESIDESKRKAKQEASLHSG